MSMNALDTALVKLSAASTALEYHSPELSDVKDAVDAAKQAAKILDAAYTLMSCGVYTVSAAPTDAKFTDPAAHKIEMPEIREEIVAELPQLPDLIGDFDQLAPNDQRTRFVDALQFLFDAAEIDADVDQNFFRDDWDHLADSSILDAWVHLQFAVHHRTPLSIDVPLDEDMATWRAQFAAPVEDTATLPALPDELVQFDNWDEADAADEFNRRLEAMAEGLDEHIYPPWELAWESDHKDAFTRLLVAEAREPKTFILPTDEERDAFLAQFAPIPEVESLILTSAIFEEKLEELADHGVKESALKRKNWKPAAQAWRDAFEQDPQGTYAKLLAALDRAVIVWDPPVEKGVA